MTRREAAIVTAYTGILIGPFSDFHAYVEQLLGREVQHVEMDEAFFAALKERAKADFVGIPVS